jgi:hypothetical protein
MEKVWVLLLLRGFLCWLGFGWGRTFGLIYLFETFLRKQTLSLSFCAREKRESAIRLQDSACDHLSVDVLNFLGDLGLKLPCNVLPRFKSAFLHYHVLLLKETIDVAFFLLVPAFHFYAWGVSRLKDRVHVFEGHLVGLAPVLI